MAKRTLVDNVYNTLLARTPHEVTSIRREKSEGTGKHSRVKAVHVDTNRLLFRVLQPGTCEELYVSTTNIPATVEAIHAMLLRNQVPLTRVGC